MTAAVEEPAGRPSGSPLTPHADKEFEKPAPARSEPRKRPESISDGPLDLRHIPTDPPSRQARPAPGVVSAAPWQWGLAILGAALFLYTVSFAIVGGLLLLGNRPAAASLTGRLGVYAVLAAGACCVLAVALPDAKTSLTAIAGGLAMRSLVAMLFLPPGLRTVVRPEWLAICGLSGGALWWLWRHEPRRRGDASRMSIALTVLAAAEALSAVYGFAGHPAAIQIRTVAPAAIVLGSLLWLRMWIPAAIGEGGPGRRPL